MTSPAGSHGQGTPCIGILGSGQLGRMIAIAAAQLGVRTHVYAPDAQASPAGEVATTTTTASYDDIESLRRFAASVDAVTSEFENVPAATMQVIGESCLASPGAAALQAAQHRIAEKTLAAGLGIPTPRFWQVGSLQDLTLAMKALGGPAILKTCRLGYDGKGQVRIKPDDDLATALEAVGSDDAILEEMIAFDGEISALLARDAQGNMVHFPVSQNRHENGILARTVAPAPVIPAIEEAAQSATAALAEAVDLVGLLAVEFFIAADEAAVQRDGTAAAQFISLDDRGLCHKPVHAAGAGSDRPRLRRYHALWTLADGQSSRPASGPGAGPAGRCRQPPPSLWQARGTPGPQDGACQPSAR